MNMELSVAEGHLCNMGRMIEEMESKLRNSLDQACIIINPSLNQKYIYLCTDRFFCTSRCYFHVFIWRVITKTSLPPLRLLRRILWEVTCVFVTSKIFSERPKPENNFYNLSFVWWSEIFVLFQVYFGKTKEMVCTLRPPSEIVEMRLPDS